MKTATVALIIKYEHDLPTLSSIVSDEAEIEVLETVARDGGPDPLSALCDYRDQRKREEEEFGDYVEDLLSQPFLRKDVQDHGVQWLKSKIRIEEYQRAEMEAAQVIADYAYKLFAKNHELRDLFLTGPNTKVRIRVFVCEPQGSIRSAA